MFLFLLLWVLFTLFILRFWFGLCVVFCGCFELLSIGFALGDCVWLVLDLCGCCCLVGYCFVVLHLLFGCCFVLLVVWGGLAAWVYGCLVVSGFTVLLVLFVLYLVTIDFRLIQLGVCDIVFLMLALFALCFWFDCCYELFDYCLCLDEL